MAGERPRCLMLDADIIIHLHRAGLWEAVIAFYQVTAPSIVIREARFYRDELDQTHPFDLSLLVSHGAITELSASLDEIAALKDSLEADLLDRLDPGEQEAIALIVSGSYAEGSFCSGDTIGIITLAALGFGRRCIALEDVLQPVGRSLNRLLRQHRNFDRRHFAELVAEGQRRRITGDGLAFTVFDNP